MAKKVIESVQDERDANVYEFAFHLVPKMSEEVKEEIKHRTDILRSLLITTKNEEPVSSADVAKALSTDDDDAPADVVVEEAVPVEEAPEEAPEAAEAEVSEDEKENDQKVDEAIDKLV